MARFTDSAHLLCEHYRNDANLTVRIVLHERCSTNRYGFHHWAYDRVALTPGAALHFAADDAFHVTKDADLLVATP